MTIGVVADIGGTNARFAVATVDGARIALAQQATLSTADFASFEAAFASYAARLPERPQVGAFALASPIAGSEIKLTNNPWVLRTAGLADRLGLARVALLNDFEAVARSVGELAPDELRPLAGPAGLPPDGMVSVVGPGSGLGVAMLLRRNKAAHVIACEGGHIGFAPADAIDAHILRFVGGRYPRVSAERLISGPGLVQVYVALAELEGRAIVPPHPVPLWQAALGGEDAHAAAALDRWLMLLGGFAGDMALAHGAAAVVLAGGVLPRLAPDRDLAPLLARFTAKGRFETAMRGLPLALIVHPQPGLLGAATLLRENLP